MADSSVLQDPKNGSDNVHSGDVEKQNTEAGAMPTRTSSPPISSSPEAKMTGKGCVSLYYLGLIAMSVTQSCLVYALAVSSPCQLKG